MGRQWPDHDEGRDAEPAAQRLAEVGREFSPETGDRSGSRECPRAVEQATRADRYSATRPVRREDLFHDGRLYRLRPSELELLATVGTFRVVPEHDLAADTTRQVSFAADVRSLTAQGLLQQVTVSLHRQPTHVLVLTTAGKRLLDARHPSGGASRQTFHAGLVKPRELAHDAQLYRLHQAEAARINAAGGRVTRVLLDYEIKSAYQAFLNRRRTDEAIQMPGRNGADRDLFAATYGLPVVNGHLEIPDLRLEYEAEDGRLEHRDLELVTEHYSRSQMAGKRQAGFGLYRAGGEGRRTGGTPYDPHVLERLS